MIHSNAQVNPLVDQLNAAPDQLLKINVDDIISSCRQKLNKWRDDCHKEIDHLYEEKCEELRQRCMERLDKQRKDIDQMKLKTNKLIQEQEATFEDIPSLQATINDIKRSVDQFEKKGILVNVQPLAIKKKSDSD